MNVRNRPKAFLALGTMFLLPLLAHAGIKMAITVDDLPDHGDLPPGVSRTEIAQSMLAALKAAHIPEVYGFINARKIEKDRTHDEVLKLWVDSGYPLGNHTYSHQDISRASIEDFEKEIDANEPYLRKWAPHSDWHYFRYPFLHEGDTREKRNAIRNYLAKKGYTIAQVSADFEDWAWNHPYTRCKRKGDQKSIEWLKSSYLESAEKRLARDDQVATTIWHRSIAQILLLHIGAFDAQMLPSLLAMYRRHGVEFIPLSEAVKDPVYQEDPALAMKSGNDFQYQVLRAKGMKLKDAGITTPSPYPEKALQMICR